MMTNNFENNEPQGFDKQKFKTELDKLLETPSLDLPQPENTTPSIEQIMTTAKTTEKVQAAKVPAPKVQAATIKEIDQTTLNDEIFDKTFETEKQENEMPQEISHEIPPQIIANKNFGSFATKAMLSIAMLSTAVAGYFIYQNFANTSDIENVPILLADTSTIRQTPEKSGGLEIGDTNHSVYKQVLDTTAPKQVTTTIIKNNNAKIETDIISSTFTQAQAASTTTPEIEINETIEVQQEPEVAVEVKPEVTIEVEPEFAVEPALELEPEPTVEVVPEPTPELEQETEIATAIPRNIGTPPARTPMKEQTAKPKNTAITSQTFAVQIASLRSRLEAQNSWRKLSQQYSSLLADYIPDIRRVELANRGTYFRLRVLTPNKTQAQQLCAEIKKLGGDCLVTK